MIPPSSSSFINSVTRQIAPEGNLYCAILTSLLWIKEQLFATLAVREAFVRGKLWGKKGGVPIFHFPHESTHDWPFNISIPNILQEHKSKVRRNVYPLDRISLALTSKWLVIFPLMPTTETNCLLSGGCPLSVSLPTINIWSPVSMRNVVR